MASIMRATLIEHYFRPPGEVAVYDPDDTDKKQLLAAWLGGEKGAHANG